MVSNFLKSKKEKNIIIDPLSCMIKLSILGFYPEGTKISVTDNQISFNEPSFYQGTIRYFKGDGREDLHNLYNAIQKCIEWYWDKDDRDIIFLFRTAIEGLKKLKKTYQPNSTIQHTLDYYICCLKGKQADLSPQKLNIVNESPSNNLLSSTNSLSNFNSNNSLSNSVSSNNVNNKLDKNTKKEELENNKIHDFLKKLWSKREIKIVIEMFKEFRSKKISKDYKDEEENFLKSINTLTETKERKLRMFLEEHHTVL